MHIKKYKSKHSKMRMRRGGEKETKEKFMTGRRRRDVLKGDNHFYDFGKWWLFKGTRCNWQD